VRTLISSGLTKEHHAAQELTYDYRFKEEAGEDKLPCGCGAPSCRGYLN
jgi:SET domain-containing protein